MRLSADIAGVRFHDRYVTERTVRAGIGAPIVALEREIKVTARANFPPSRVFYSVTAVARFDGERCTLSFEDPLSVETVAIDGHTFPLAADRNKILAGVEIDQITSGIDPDR